MRKFIIALFITVFAATAFAQEDENILYILDGKIVSKTEFANIDPARVKSMKVVKGWLMTQGNLTLASMLTTVRDMMGFNKLAVSFDSFGKPSAKELAKLNRQLNKIKK